VFHPACLLALPVRLYPISPCSVDETYEQVKESESDQILRNKALIIDEIESTVSSYCQTSAASGVRWCASGAVQPAFRPSRQSSMHPPSLCSWSTWWLLHRTVVCC
jgi:hypothetical protein